MFKGVSNKKYTGEFKQKVVESLRKRNLSYFEQISNDTGLILHSDQGCLIFIFV